MKRNLILSKEARQYILEQLHSCGEMTKDEITELIRPHCSFDPKALQEQALGRLVSSIVRSMRDEKGVRTAFLVHNGNSVVDIETCRSLSKISAVEQQLAKQMNGLILSHKKALHRKEELSGQVSLFEKGASI